jgi:nicotinate-nucleotide adenylyltransferase
MKKIALFGGSFNPPHDGHFEAAKYIYETLKVDEVWFLFSVNWQKDPSQYATCAERMEMGRILQKHYPDMPFVMSDIQEELGTHITSEVLAKIQERYPDDRFIWTMGADSLLSFDTWEKYDEIMERFPIAVLVREPYTAQALKSPAALTYEHLKIDDPTKLAEAPNGWIMLDNPSFDLASSKLLQRLRAGETKFDGGFQDVADSIIAKNLYGLNAPSPPPPQDAPKFNF